MAILPVTVTIVIAPHDMMTVNMTVIPGATTVIDETEVIGVATGKGNNPRRVLMSSVVVGLGMRTTDVETTVVTVVEVGVGEKMTSVKDLVAVAMMTVGDVEETGVEVVVAVKGMWMFLRRGHLLLKVRSHFLREDAKLRAGMWRLPGMNNILRFKLSRQVCYLSSCL